MLKASVVEFYSPGRFFMVAQSPELLGALNSISTELQKTYSCPSVTTYVPCTGEVCAVQFSCDMVSKGLLKQFDKMDKYTNMHIGAVLDFDTCVFHLFFYL